MVRQRVQPQEHVVRAYGRILPISQTLQPHAPAGPLYCRRSILYRRGRPEDDRRVHPRASRRLLLRLYKRRNTAPPLKNSRQTAGAGERNEIQSTRSARPDHHTARDARRDPRHGSRRPHHRRPEAADIAEPCRISCLRRFRGRNSAGHVGKRQRENTQIRQRARMPDFRPQGGARPHRRGA